MFRAASANAMCTLQTHGSERNDGAETVASGELTWNSGELHLSQTKIESLTLLEGSACHLWRERLCKNIVFRIVVGQDISDNEGSRLVMDARSASGSRACGSMICSWEAVEMLQAATTVSFRMWRLSRRQLILSKHAHVSRCPHVQCVPIQARA